MPPLPDPKLTQLKARVAAGDWPGALRIAARFPQLGDHKARIERGWNALQRPDFYRELGYDTAELVRDAYRALAERYALPQTPPA